MYHVPVMAKEVLEGLSPARGGVVLDCTLGGGGHSELLLREDPATKLVGIDKDADAIAYNARLSEAFPGRVTLVRGAYEDAPAILDSLGIDRLDGVLMDLGISSHQIDVAERGFSYVADAPLDMRMDRDRKLTAASVVNGYSEEALRRIFRDYGEEPHAARIAARIVTARAERAIETTTELARLIESCVSQKERAKRGHPAKRVFQAIRIEVNGELTRLGETVEALVERLRPGGRIAVITFHSLEDRIVKQTFSTLATDCICDKSLPVCVCGHRASVKLWNRKPLVSGAEELAANPRAASAKLRIAEKLNV